MRADGRLAELAVRLVAVGECGLLAVAEREDASRVEPVVAAVAAAGRAALRSDQRVSREGGRVLCAVRRAALGLALRLAERVAVAVGRSLPPPGPAARLAPARGRPVSGLAHVPHVRAQRGGRRGRRDARAARGPHRAPGHDSARAPLALPALPIALPFALLLARHAH